MGVKEGDVFCSAPHCCDPIPDILHLNSLFFTNKYIFVLGFAHISKNTTLRVGEKSDCFCSYSPLFCGVIFWGKGLANVSGVWETEAGVRDGDKF